MKIWIKLLIGSIIGIGVSYLIPAGSEPGYAILSYLSGLVIKIGRYVVFPLVFFSLAVGTFELKKDHMVLRTYGRIILYMTAATVLLVVIGTVSVIALSPERIPIVIEEELAYSLPGVTEVLDRIFPTNMFRVLAEEGSFLLPVSILAFLLGLNFTFDRLMTRPVVQFFDSMSRILYHINSFVLEIIGLGMVAVSAFLFHRLRSAPDLALFNQLIVVLAIDALFVTFILYPGIHYLLGERRAPFAWLYAALGPAVAGLVSGDNYFSLSVLIRHGKENHGIPRRIGSAAFPITALFGRAGSALVAASAFIVILKSYSSLGITIFEVLWIIGVSVGVSFFLSPVPGIGAITAVALLCGYYGRGLEEGYLILHQAAPILICAGVYLDTITAAFVSMLAARHEGALESVTGKDYV